MYRTGHLGVSLLVFAPIGYALVNAGNTTLAFVAGAAMLWLAMLPDADHNIPKLSHRGPTHTLLFAALVGLVFGAAGYALQYGYSAALGHGVTGLGPAAFDVAGVGPLATFGFFVGAVTIVAHLLGDWLTPMGVAFFWPLSGRRYSLGLTPAKSPFWNYGLFVLGVFAAAGSVALGFGVV